MSQSILEVRVTLKGRPVREFRFSDARITIGRDPSSNIFLDNPGISREHAILERKGTGIYVQDLGSANGTFLNDAQILRERVREGDRVRVGKFSLEVRLEEDRRGTESGRSPGAAFEGTMVLETAQIDRLMTRTKEAESLAAVMSETEREGNVVRARVHPMPGLAAARESEPARGLAWWKSQVWGLAIGFFAGVVAGALIIHALAG